MAFQEQHIFAGAAVHLGKTQSAVTQQMQRLEDQIGYPLFECTGPQAADAALLISTES